MSQKSSPLVKVGLIVVVGAVLIIAVFGDKLYSGNVVSPEMNEVIQNEAMCKVMVKKRMKDPDSAEFSDVRLVPPRIMGIVRAKNSFGAVVPQAFECTVENGAISNVSIVE